MCPLDQKTQMRGLSTLIKIALFEALKKGRTSPCKIFKL